MSVEYHPAVEGELGEARDYYNRACPKRVDFRNVIRFDNGCREQKQTKAASGSAAVGFSEKFPGTVHTAPVVFRF